MFYIVVIKMNCEFQDEIMDKKVQIYRLSKEIPPPSYGKKKKSHKKSG
jgi:hypothetical protein